jgi:leucyl aminopeptidase
MRYSSTSGPLAALKTDCLVVSAATGARVARALGCKDYFEKATRDFEDAAGKVALIALPNNGIRRALLVGGSDAELSPDDFRKSLLAVSTALKAARFDDAVLALGGIRVTGYDDYRKVRWAAALLSSALYWFDDQKSEPPKERRISKIAIHVHEKAPGARTADTVGRAVRHAGAVDAGLTLARDLGNQPPNVCNPTYLAREARKLAGPRTRVRVMDESQIEAHGMGAFMAVTRGSQTPGKLIVIQHRGTRAAEKPFVIIGKGITFDTGGISLKPGAGMDEMKFDMCGAAAVLGTVKAVATARLPVNLIGIVAAAENMPSGDATRPGDIVRSMSGQTIEILNTDAEGRLVLCDALTYAERFEPKAVIDIATLTGACVVALGAHASGLFANNDALAQALIDSGGFIGDRAWQMPLWDDYQTQLKSNFADMANIGGREAGAVVAACFLSRFTKRYPWAHLDVAGTAYLTGANKGSTGRPLPLLFQYLANMSA